jgi:hypothetical protein
MMPLLIVPYLSPENLAILDDHDISGIDLCGNGVLLSSKNRVWRTGYPNMYKDTRPIRNPFHGDSSIFARCFLLQPQYNSLSDLRSFAMRKAFSDAYELLSPGFALGTASKVVKTLEEELVIKKGEDGIALQDARRLISLLRLGLRPPLQSRVAGKTPITFEEVWNRLAGARLNGTLRSVATGLSSAGRYKVLSGIDRQCLYVDDLTLAGELLEIQPGKAFANIEIIEDHKHLVYFDARAEGNVLWASPIQTWLELSSAGPREQEAAGLLENLLAEGHGADML